MKAQFPSKTVLSFFKQASQAKVECKASEPGVPAQDRLARQLDSGASINPMEWLVARFKLL